MNYIPPYKITPKITDLVSLISEAIGSYSNVKNLRLNRISRIQTIQGTLAIEGNNLSTDQITAILEDKPVLAPMNEIQEVRNAIKCYELLDSLDQNSIDDLLKAHLTLETGLIDDAGKFRSKSVGVASGDEIIHYAPPADMVPYLINDLFEWLSATDEHSLIKSCVFHYEFEFIHPFSDGNGRMGRLWQTLILSNWRQIFRNLPIENIVYKYRDNYYRAIALSGGDDGCTPFIEFLLGVILEILTTQKTTQKTTQITTQKSAPKSVQERILDNIVLNPRVTRYELASILGISTDGVKYHIKKLVDLGRIERIGGNRGGWWRIIS